MGCSSPLWAEPWAVSPIASGLDSRGIGGVDIDHDDRTTIIQFAFTSCNLHLLQTVILYLLYIHYTLPYVFKLTSSEMGLIVMRF